MSHSQSQQRLLYEIGALDFALDDTVLFLDTHPDNHEALHYYHEVHEKLKKARDEYIEQYGPLTNDSVMSHKRWTWVDNPWPWEGEI